MRTIARLSAAFQLVDGYSKEGVKGASFLVDGAPVPFVAKPDGTYVFSNLPILPHIYQMIVPGYLPVQRTLPARPEFFPEVVILQHSPEGPCCKGSPVFICGFWRKNSRCSRKPWK